MPVQHHGHALKLLFDPQGQGVQILYQILPALTRVGISQLVAVRGGVAVPQMIVTAKDVARRAPFVYLSKVSFAVNGDTLLICP